LYTIDLHGLTVSESIDFVEKRLEEVSGCEGILKIITGSGKHSNQEKSILKPKIEELLSQRALYYKIKHGNIDVICE
jgi:DNA-nicking Smr family endonuclease